MRKEKGNPPGKREDPLGDQLTWEQLLSHAKGKSKVWIISSDQDYFAKLEGKRFLNPFLHQELVAVNTAPTQVFCFDNLDEAIRDFVKQTGVKAEALPTEEESRKIEEEALKIKDDVTAVLVPVPVGWLSSNANSMDAVNAVIQQYAARQRNEALYTMANSSRFTPGMPPDEPHK